MSMRLYQSANQTRGYLDWNPNPINSLDFFFIGVDDITDLIYKRLLTRLGMPLASQGRIYTLLNAISINLSYIQLNLILEGSAF